MTAAMPAAKWERLVDARFGFLRVEFGCEIVERSDESGWITKLVYQNSTTAVEVIYDVEFERVEVRLIRLINGERPPYPIFISEKPQLHDFSLDHLLKLRAGDRLQSLKEHFSLDRDEVEVQLELLAAGLKDFGRDVLLGDFTSFERMEADLREVVQKHPEKVQVSIPHGSDPTPEIEKLRRLHPTIPIIVREYVPPRRRSLLERLGSWITRLRR